MELKYLVKPANTISGNFQGNYRKPATCPYCGYGTDATFVKKDSYTFNGHYILTATCKCTSCGKVYDLMSFKNDSITFSDDIIGKVTNYSLMAFGLCKNCNKIN